MNKPPRKYRRTKENFELTRYVTNLEKTSSYLFLIIGGILSLLGTFFIFTNYTDVGLAKIPRYGDRLVVINGPFLLFLSLACFVAYFFSYRAIQKKKRGGV